MVQQQWEVEPTTGRCAVTGRTLEEGEEFYTVLFEDGESFRRVDYSLEAWEGTPEGSYCHFKSRIPIKEKRKKLLVDNELLINFFIRLAEETEPVRLQFRFVLALILMRKRLLRYEGSAVREGVETWELVLTHEQTRHQVINPRLTDDQIEGVSKQLGAILHGDMGEWTLARDENGSATELPADKDQNGDG
jgi:hypothetical protein